MAKRRRPAGAEFDAESDAARKPTGGPRAYEDLLRGFRNLHEGGASPELTERIGEALLMVLGSGPSVAVLESVLAANQASGAMYLNAVSHQHKTNLIGMAMTAKCVKYMLDMPNNADTALEDIEQLFPGLFPNAGVGD